jgi:hypothetical protein
MRIQFDSETVNKSQDKTRISLNYMPHTRTRIHHMKILTIYHLR